MSMLAQDNPAVKRYSLKRCPIFAGIFIGYGILAGRLLILGNDQASYTARKAVVKMLNIFFRALLLYLLVIFAVRMMGKRQLGDLQPSEIVTTILIGNIASLPIEEPSLPMAAAIVPVLTLAAFEVVVSEAGLKWRRLRLLFSGRPQVIIREGQIDQQAMKRIRFTLDDLMENLRGEGVFDIREVWHCVVETNGKVNVLQKFPSRPATPGDLSLKGSDSRPPLMVIADGKVVQTAMERMGVSPAWLDRVLEQKKLRREDVFLMTVDGGRKPFIVEKEGRKV